MKKIKNKIKVRIKAIKRKYEVILNAVCEQTFFLNLDKRFSTVLKRFCIRWKQTKNKPMLLLRMLFGSRAVIVVFTMILMAKTLFFYQNLKLEVSFWDNTYQNTLFFIMLTLSPLLFVRKERHRFKLMIVLDIFFSILLFADNLYWDFAVNMLSVSQVLYVKYAEEITQTLPLFLDESQIWYFIDIPIFILLWLVAKFPLRKKKTKYATNVGKRKILWGTLLLILFLNFTMPQMQQSFQAMSENSYLKFSQVTLGSIYGYHYWDIYHTLNAKEKTKYKTYDKMMIAYENLQNNLKEDFQLQENMSGIAKGKNIIVLQLESIQNFMIRRTINGKEITPNLNEFLENNIEMTKMISQSYSTTADSEYSVMTSLYPLENGEVFSIYHTNIDNDIFNLYQKEGYHTSYMHGNVKEFWNRVNVYDRLNFDEISYIYDFTDTSEKIQGYLSDELLYRQAVQKMKTYGNPFFTFMVAASSHTPYNLEGIIDKEKKITIDVGKYQETQFGNYLEAANYADYAFGIFLEELKLNGLYNDTVIIVFGDHYGISLENEEMGEFMKEKNPNFHEIDQYINYVNVVCGMKIPDVEKVKIEVPVSKIDIKPTLLHIMGIEDNFSLGKSIFSTKDYANISIGSIVTKEDYYHNEEWYNIMSGEKLNLEQLEEEKRKKLANYEKNVKLELDISQSIIYNNLLKKK